MRAHMMFVQGASSIDGKGLYVKMITAGRGEHYLVWFCHRVISAFLDLSSLSIHTTNVSTLFFDMFIDVSCSLSQGCQMQVAGRRHRTAFFQEAYHVQLRNKK